MKLIVLGRVLGTCEGWDAVETCKIVFIECKFNENALGLRTSKAGDICVDFEAGRFYTVDDDTGEEDWCIDIIEVLKDVPRTET